MRFQDLLPRRLILPGQLRDEHGGIKSAEYFVSAEDAIIDVDSIQEADWKTLYSLNEDGTFSEPIECENKKLRGICQGYRFKR